MTRFFKLLAALLLVLGLGRAAAAQEFVARQIENLVSTDSLKLKIDGLSGAVSGNLRIASVTLSDPQGPFLTARDLAMDWSPFGLVRSNIAIQSLTAGQITLDRLPQLPPAPANAASSGGGLPNITADIQKIAISEFVLGEAVAGTAARLSLDAKLLLQADPTQLETTLAVERLDRPGRINATVAYAPADNRLQVSIDAGEPEGGLVAGLLKIPGAPPVQLTVNGAGPLSDFMANGALSVGADNAATLTARVTAAPDGRQVNAALNVAAERFAPAAVQPYVRGGANLDAALLIRPDGVIAINQATLSSDAVRLALSGTLDRAGPRTALDLALTAPDGGAIPVRLGEGPSGTVIEVAQLRGTLAGALPAARLDLSATLPQLASGPYGARGLTLALASPGFDLSGLAGPLSIRAQAASVTAPEGVQRRFTDGAVRLQADGSLASNSVTLAAAQLSTGAANVALAGTAALNFSTFDLRLTGDFQTLALSAALTPIAGERTSLGGRFLRDANGTLAAQDLTVRSTGLSVDGTARLAGEAVEANVRGTLDVQPAENAAVSGRADFALIANGPTAAPNLDLTLDSQGLRVNGRELANLKASARGTFTGENPSGTVTLAGTIDGTPLDGSARLETLPSGERRVSDLVVSQGPNRIAGDLRITAKAVPVGRLTVAVPDVAPLAALALQKASGDLNGRIDLSVSADDVPKAAVDLTANKLTAAGNTLSNAVLDLSVADYLGKPRPSGTIRADRIEAGGVTVEGLSLDLSDAGDGTRLTAAAKANGVPVTLAGVATITPTETALALETLTADIRDAAVALRAPTRVTIANGTTTLSPTEIGVGAGAIRLQGTAGGQLNLTAALDAVPVAVANPFVPGLAASGTLTGEATVSGAAADPQARFRIEASAIETAQTRAGRLPGIAARAEGTYAGGILDLPTTTATLGTGSLQASGRVGANLLDLSARLDALPAALANGFVAGLDASGTLSGTAKATGTPAAPNATFDLAGTGLTAKAVADAGVPPIELAASGSYADRLLTLTKARATIGEAFVEASGTAGATALNLSARLQNVPVALANGFVSNLEASGTISGEATVTGQPSDPAAAFTLAGTGISAEAVRRSGVPPLSLDVAGRYAAATATIERARLLVGDGRLEATGTAGAKALNLDVVADRLPLGLANGFSPDLGAAGTLSGRLAARGNPNDPTAEFTLTGTGITTNQIRAANLAPAALDLSGRYSGGTATIASARATLGDGALTASGTVGRALNLNVALDDLPVAIANGFVQNLGAEGTLSGSAEATGSLTDPTATFELQGRGISVAETRRGRVPALSLDLSGRYASGTAEIGTARVAVGTGTITATGSIGQTLDLKATATRLPLALADGFVAGLGAQGTLSGTATASGPTANPRAAFDLRAEGLSTAQTRGARLPAAAIVAAGTYADGAVAIRTARATVGGGVVEVTGRAGRELDLSVAIRNLPAALGAAAAPGIDPAGTINGTARATGPAANPNATFNLAATGLSVAQTRQAGIGALAFRADGRFENRRLTFNSNLTGAGGLALAANGNVDLAAGPRFDVRANGSAPLSLANRILAEGGRAAQGTVRLDVQATGTPAAPNVTGTISTSGASFTDTGANVALRGINATINLSGQTATIASFRANLAAGGTVSAGGTVGITGGFPANLRIGVDNGRYADGTLVAATLDAALTITGRLTATPLLAGSIDIQKLDVEVPASLPSSLARIDVTRRNAPPRVAKQQRELFPPAKRGGSGGGIALDIAFNAPSRIFVRGRGLDAQLGGNLKITGSAAAPAITGGFELQRGRLVILNKRLDFERGRLAFAGDLIPLLDFLATSDSGDVTVNVAVTGPANDPSFSFSSTPALPQDEVLARLIFNQGTTNLSPLQIAQLAEAAAQLAGVGGSTGLLENLRSQLGVDDIDIRTTADGQTAVGVGKYINDRTYFGVDSTGRASINLDVGKGLKARGAVSATGGGEVGVFYENEF